MKTPALSWLRIKHWVAVALLATAGHAIDAQTDQDIAQSFQKPSQDEDKRLRAILARPEPEGLSTDQLRAHLREKMIAATQLGDQSLREAILRDAVRRAPDGGLQNTLARDLLTLGKLEEGNALMRQALASADRYAGLFFLANIYCDMYRQNKQTEAQATLEEINQKFQATPPGSTRAQQAVLLRAVSMRDGCISQSEQRQGRFAQAIEAAQSGEKNARAADQLLPQNLFIKADVATLIARRFATHLAAGQLYEAQQTLLESMQYATQAQLPAGNLAGIYASAARLRFAQRQFQQSEQLMRKAEAALASLGREPTRIGRLTYANEIILALIGQKKWWGALQALEQLDRLAGDDPRLKKQVAFEFTRGLAYLGNQRNAQAAPLFETLAKNNRAFHGEAHFYTAQASGLQGVALWRTHAAESQHSALALLRASVRHYMAPANADYVGNVGLGLEIRDMIFAAYFEAMHQLEPHAADQTLGAADWIFSGTVQDAVGDAAIRAAASTPALAAIVRREQDAKNEITGLREFLGNPEAGHGKLLPEISAPAHARLKVLDLERTQLQSQIKAQFPQYDQLVRPSLPKVQDIAGRLNPEQALLVLLPTPQAVFVWAVTADQPAQFFRAPVHHAALQSQVLALRDQMDFSQGIHKQGEAFDATTAYKLYQSLLEPLAPTLAHKTQWVIAAGGKLSQLPFAILHTEATEQASRPDMPDHAPWLIRKAAITQIPSLSAWMAIQSIAKAPPAPQALAGWGDPVFNPLAPAKPPARIQSRSLTFTRTTGSSLLAQIESILPEAPTLKYADIPDLPDTREELLAIADILRANPAEDVMLGPQATRDSVLQASRTGKLAQKKVIVFATHGLMAGDLPHLTQPALALAATGREQKEPLAPLLTLQDVLTLKLNADWVILSACNTAAADGKAEESLSGLARGFFYAGGRSLLVTHWAVESESAKLLTTHTLAHYTANRQAPKAESLRQAMLKVMAMPRYAHPAFWAPYALVGDGGR